MITRLINKSKLMVDRWLSHLLMLYWWLSYRLILYWWLSYRLIDVWFLDYLTIYGWFIDWRLILPLMVGLWIDGYILMLCSTIDKIDWMVYLLKYCTAGERVERCQQERWVNENPVQESNCRIRQVTTPPPRPPTRPPLLPTGTKPSLVLIFLLLARNRM